MYDTGLDHPIEERLEEMVKRTTTYDPRLNRLIKERLEEIVKRKTQDKSVRLDYDDPFVSELMDLYVPEEKEGDLSTFVDTRLMGAVFYPKSRSNDATKQVHNDNFFFKREWDSTAECAEFEVKIAVKTKRMMNKTKRHCPRPVGSVEKEPISEQLFKDIKKEIESRLSSLISLVYREVSNGTKKDVVMKKFLSFPNTDSMWIKDISVDLSSQGHLVTVIVSKKDGMMLPRYYSLRVYALIGGVAQKKPVFCIGSPQTSWVDVYHFVRRSRFAYAFDAEYSNLLNSVTGYINRRGDEEKNIVIPLDKQAHEWGVYQEEALGRPYSWIALLFSISNIVSFSGVRSCVQSLGDLKPLASIIPLSREMKKLLSDFSIDRGAITDLLSLWTGSEQQVDPFKYVIREIHCARFNRMKIESETDKNSPIDTEPSKRHQTSYTRKKAKKFPDETMGAFSSHAFPFLLTSTKKMLLVPVQIVKGAVESEVVVEYIYNAYAFLMNKKRSSPLLLGTEKAQIEYPLSLIHI